MPSSVPGAATPEKTLSNSYSSGEIQTAAVPGYSAKQYSVVFTNGSTDLPPEAKTALDDIAKKMANIVDDAALTPAYSASVMAIMLVRRVPQLSGQLPFAHT
ncbi:MAG: hypothetical protein R3E60_06060 [Alphaproteobacteria bacterium]